MKKWLYVSLICSCVGLSGEASANWIFNPQAQPFASGDPATSIVGTVAGLIASFIEPEMGAAVNVTQAEAAALQDGSKKYEQLEMSGSATSQGFGTTAYDYLEQRSMSGSTKTPYAYFNDRLTSLFEDESKVTDSAARGNIQKENYNKAVQMVKDRFFVEKAEDLTPEKEAEIRNLRAEYLQTIATDYALTAQEVQTRLASDFDTVITTPFNGDGLLGAISGIDQTWLAATRALMADIALQLQLLELDASKFLDVQPIELLEDPDNSTSTPNSGTTT